MWPSKISNGPPKKSEGGQTWPSKLLTWGQHSYTEPSRKNVLPSEIRSFFEKDGTPNFNDGTPIIFKVESQGPPNIQLDVKPWVPGSIPARGEENFGV